MRSFIREIFPYFFVMSSILLSSCVSTSTPMPTLAFTTQPDRHPFSGKKVVLLGTSLTYQGLYLPYLQARTEIATIVNRGISGQLVRTMADKLSAIDLAGASLITIEGSTNDYGHGFSVAGQTTDPIGVASLCADVKYVVQKIRLLDAAIPIVIMNDTARGPISSDPVPPAPNAHGLTMDDASNAMMNTAAYLNLAHWDAYHLSGITQQNYGLYTSDNLHWNYDGAELIGNGLGDYLNTL